MQELPTAGDVPKKMGRGPGRTIFWLIVILIATSLLYVALKPQGQEVNAPSNDQAVEETPVTNYEYMIPNDWDGAERAQDDIQSLTDGQTIEYGIVEDPTDENVVYFASSAFDNRSRSNLVSIYQYRTDDYSFERLFRTTYEQGNPLGLDERILPRINVIGYENGSLVLLASDVDDSPGPCSSSYLITADDKRSLFTLDLNDPYAGFENYQPSEELVAIEQAGVNACQAAM